jgi:hypothetical protein
MCHYVLGSFSILKMEVVDFSKTFLLIYQIHGVTLQTKLYIS